MSKTKPTKNAEINALLRGARGRVIAVPDDDADEAKKQRKERNARMNAALRAAARGFTDDDIDNGKVT